MAGAWAAPGNLGEEFCQAGISYPSVAVIKNTTTKSSFGLWWLRAEPFTVESPSSKQQAWWQDQEAKSSHFQLQAPSRECELQVR